MGIPECFHCCFLKVLQSSPGNHLYSAHDCTATHFNNSYTCYLQNRWNNFQDGRSSTKKLHLLKTCGAIGSYQAIPWSQDHRFLKLSKMPTIHAVPLQCCIQKIQKMFHVMFPPSQSRTHQHCHENMNQQKIYLILLDPNRFRTILGDHMIYLSF